MIVDILIVDILSCRHYECVDIVSCRHYNVDIMTVDIT